MKSVNFVSAKELDPFTAMALNVRFMGYLLKFSEKIREMAVSGKVTEETSVKCVADALIDFSRDIMADADIPQGPANE